MAERYTIPINRKQGAVLSTLGCTVEEKANNYSYIGVEFAKDEEKKTVEELIGKGLLVREADKLIQTDLGKDVAFKFGATILYED
ncbi:MAG: hypothetical protein AAB622_02715 [Patescibacteria group bacterium]